MLVHFQKEKRDLSSNEQLKVKSGILVRAGERKANCTTLSQTSVTYHCHDQNDLIIPPA